jgi:hypothetical protein
MGSSHRLASATKPAPLYILTLTLNLKENKMNPLSYELTAVCERNEQKPNTTAEKIGNRLNELSKQRDEDYNREFIYRIQREGAEAIRILSNEIDILKIEIAGLKEKK